MIGCTVTLVPIDVLRDSSISIGARGALAVMMSLPQTEAFSVKQLREIMGLGREKMSRILAELERAGYVLRDRPRNADGRLWGSEVAVNPTLFASSGSVVR